MVDRFLVIETSQFTHWYTMEVPRHQPLLLTKDSLASFLQDLGDLSTLTRGVCDPEAVSSSKPLKSDRPKPRDARTINEAVVSRNTKAEHDGRVNALNKKICTLYQELQRLHLLDPELCPSTSAKWKRRAATERFARTRAEYENESLRQHVARGLELQEQLKKLLFTIELHSMMFTSVAYPVIDNDAHAFGVLKTDLLQHQTEIENSIQNRLEVIAHRSLLPRHIQAANNWGIAVNRQVMHMHVEELDVLPFNAGMVNAAVYQSTQEGSAPVDGNRVHSFAFCLCFSVAYALT